MTALSPSTRHRPDPAARGSHDLRALHGRLRGDLITPTDRSYEERRLVRNALVDRRPTAIVAAADPADVIRAVGYAREHDLPIAVRGGGHSLSGHGTADDAIVLDMSGMKAMHVDAERRVAWAEAGLTAGEYSLKAHEFGLATPFGDTASVGIVGLTLGGGIGYLVRKHGLAVDNLVSAELVTADGRLVVAREDENPDLFWALRGGGGNFGVVTGVELRLHEAGTVYGGGLFLPATHEVIRGVADVSASAPDDLTTIVFIMGAPPAPFIPEAQRGKVVAGVVGVYAGDHGAGERAFAPLRSLAAPVADLVGPMPYPAVYEYTKAASEGRHGEAIRTLYLDALPDEAIETIIDFMDRRTSPMAIVQLRVLGGAMARVDPSATAFAHRGKPAMVTIITPFVGPAAAEEHEAWTEGLYEALHPFGSGAYVNFLGDDGEERILEAYPEATYARLADVKRRWDPDNVFRLNQNIVPSPVRAGQQA